MALETLKDVKEIDGFKVALILSGNQWIEHLKTDHYIDIDHFHNAIRFKIQDGPIKENGVNGCQVDTIIQAAFTIIEGLNDKFPCEENRRCLNNLGLALIELKDRKKNRESRGVEGSNKL